MNRVQNRWKRAGKAGLGNGIGICGGKEMNKYGQKFNGNRSDLEFII
jgi:hypothetical protein